MFLFPYLSSPLFPWKDVDKYVPRQKSVVHQEFYEPPIMWDMPDARTFSVSFYKDDLTTPFINKYTIPQLLCVPYCMLWVLLRVGEAVAFDSPQGEGIVVTVHRVA